MASIEQRIASPVLDRIPKSDAARTDLDTRVAQRLAVVDWNFSNRVGHSDIEGLHPYPAKFVAELPRALLDAVPIPPGTAVFDPFCGSGTVLVESQRRGVPSMGIDLNPIACLMSQVKTAPLPPGLDDVVREVVHSAQHAPEAPIPTIPNLNHWFEPPVQRALAALTRALKAAPAAHLDALRLALSSIIVRVSNQESDTRYAAVKKRVSADQVFRAFSQASATIQRTLDSRCYPLVPADVMEADTLTLAPSAITKDVGLVITSPPYPNAYEYWLYHKYRMWWLGFDPLAVKAREIGARAHFFRKNPHTHKDFERQMKRSLELIRAVLVRGAFACFVIGRSRIHGRIVDNARILEEVAIATGFRRVFSTERVLSPGRKSFNLSHANIKTETVLVFREDTECA